MNFYFIISILVILIIVLFFINLSNDQNIKYMNLYEIINSHLKLYLINKSGLIYLNKEGTRLLKMFSNDPLFIHTHRKLNNKYGSVVLMPVITKKTHYYILDPKLAKKILEDSPKLFSAGKIKEDFFLTFMPKNLGISKCISNEKCPWKKRRDFNENVLGTKGFNQFFDCINRIVANNVKRPLLNINDFKEVSFKIVSETIYGSTDNLDVNILKDYIKNVTTVYDLLATDFYKVYIKHLENSYKDSPKCSLLNYANLYRNDTLDIINDQIPHWFAPFIFIINFLIPNLMCVILNFRDIYDKIIIEINSDNFDLYSKNTYLHYCVIEHIRLFNTININMQRTVQNNMKYHNIDFKKGDQIFILFSSILRDKELFSQPDTFNPDRWKNRDTKSQEIVFGVGPQICPSKQISPIFYKSIITYLLRNFKYKSVSHVLKSRELYFINPYDITFTTD
uniref:Cytochrome P450 n=1 Tax=viral metagenome TaxID=1070528 RepID=A0A6C0JC57_9ZZZZ